MKGFRCSYCGRFISMQELENCKAIHELVTPDSDFTSEEFETYHILCKETK